MRVSIPSPPAPFSPPHRCCQDKRTGRWRKVSLLARRKPLHVESRAVLLTSPAQDKSVWTSTAFSLATQCGICGHRKHRRRPHRQCLPDAVASLARDPNLSPRMATPAAPPLLHREAEGTESEKTIVKPMYVVPIHCACARSPASPTDDRPQPRSASRVLAGPTVVDDEASKVGHSIAPTRVSP